MAIELSTAGIKVKWAVETTVGTRPTTGYTALTGVKSISEFNPEPNQIDVTPLEELEWHRYIPGLKDVGGAQQLTVNDYDDFRTSWDAMMTAYYGDGTSQNPGAKSQGKALWIEYNVPGITSKPSFFYSAEPQDLGFNGAEVDSAYENVAYLTPNKVAGWAAASA